MGPDTLLVVDSMNYIKGFRYQMYCAAREHKLRLGYYAVRLPTDEDRARKVTPAQARELAARVFDTVAPWKDVKALPGPSRLGVEALIRDLSPLLLDKLIAA